MTRAWAGIAVIVCLVAGCGSTVTGTAIKAGSTDSGAGSGGPNPGNFPTKPRPPVDKAGSPKEGALAEARRMGDNVVLAYQVDPILVNSGIMQGAFRNPGAVSDWFSPAISDVINGHNFVAGFLSAGDTHDRNPDTGTNGKELMNTVLRFATPEDATAAVQEMSAKGAVLTFLDKHYPTHPISIPRHPDSAGFGYAGSSDNANVLAYTAHGPYVLGQWLSDRSGAEDGQNLVAATIDQQLPLIDAFAPTPVDQLASLPVDPTGMVFRTIPPAKETTRVPGSYGLHAALAYQDDAAKTKEIFDAAGVDVETFSRLNVIRARDAAGADKIVHEFAAAMQSGHGFTPSEGIAGLPGSRCLTHPLQFAKRKNQVDHYCLVSVDRYAVEASDQQIDVVTQMVAAQLLMLKAH